MSCRFAYDWQTQIRWIEFEICASSDFRFQTKQLKSHCSKVYISFHMRNHFHLTITIYWILNSEWLLLFSWRLTADGVLSKLWMRESQANIQCTIEMKYIQVILATWLLLIWVSFNVFRLTLAFPFIVVGSFFLYHECIVLRSDSFIVCIIYENWESHIWNWIDENKFVQLQIWSEMWDFNWLSNGVRIFVSVFCRKIDGLMNGITLSKSRFQYYQPQCAGYPIFMVWLALNKNFIKIT